MLSPLFNGMDQNQDWNSCCMSCWNSLGNLCPDICRGFNFQEWINTCWNNFCNNCYNIFGNQNANQCDYQSVGEGEHQTEYNEGTEAEVHEGEEQHYNTEEEWKEMPSTSQGQTSRYHYLEEEEEECEAEYEDDEYEGEAQEEYDQEEMHSGHYNPDIHDQFGQMNIGGKFYKVNKRLLEK